MTPRESAPRTYHEALTYWTVGQPRRGTVRRPAVALGPYTLVALDDATPPERLAVRLGATPLVVFWRHGSVSLYGGSRTRTERTAINACLHYGRGVRRKPDGQWYLVINDAHFPFADGITIEPGGAIRVLPQEDRHANRPES